MNSIRKSLWERPPGRDKKFIATGRSLPQNFIPSGR